VSYDYLIDLSLRDFSLLIVILHEESGQAICHLLKSKSTIYFIVKCLIKVKKA